MCNYAVSSKKIKGGRFMKKFLAIVLSIAMFLTLAVGCGSEGNKEEVSSNTSTQEEEKVVVVAMSSDPMHFNNNSSDAAYAYANSNIMSQLLRNTITTDLHPDLAKTWEVSEDGLEYTFNLVENVKWHDGEKFTSKDVKWTIDNIIEQKGVRVDRLKDVKEIKCPDDNTVVVELKSPNAAIINVIGTIEIMPAHLYEGTDWLDNPANQHPIGTGPFKFVEHKKGVSVTLEAFDDYFLGRPEIDKIIYMNIPDENTVVQAYLNNEVDVMDLAAAISPAAVPTLEKTPNTKIQTMISTDRQYMVTNMQKSPWDNVKVRQAIAYALDRDEMVKKAHKGYAVKAEGFYTPGVKWAYTDEYKMPEKNIEKAKQLLDEAGFKPDSDGVRIKDAEIVIFQFAVFTDIARVAQANLKEIGIESTITTLEYAAWNERLKKGDFDIAIIGGNHGPDPDGMSIRVGTGGILNFMGYSSPVVDSLLKKGVVESDINKRREIYVELQKVLSEDLPVLPLTEWCYIIVTRDNITGHPIELKEKAGAAEYYFMDMN